MQKNDLFVCYSNVMCMIESDGQRELAVMKVKGKTVRDSAMVELKGKAVCESAMVGPERDGQGESSVQDGV